MNEQERNLERLGDAEHERWAAWVRSHLKKGNRLPNGDLVFPAGYIRHLENLCAVSYAELDATEQDKDKKVVYEFLGEVSFIRENLPECPYGPVEEFWE